MGTERGLLSRACGLLLAALLASGCLSLRWRRSTTDRPPESERLAALVPGVSDLDACLHELGAPNEVWELPGGGTALAWAWSKSRSLGASVSIPLAEHANASFDYDRADATREAYVAFFDRSLVLRELRRGRLADLRAATSPSLPEPLLEPDAEQ
ncbi:MAG: hypothetical protein FJ299_03780 [Planctomycetes bacterium]|nr:hypothetical protein [Planctomycetota bacterium]